jgi:periplasmic protein TonB
MGYQALLFCADEKLARVVSQVFTELDFAIEPVTEPFAAVKKLMAQRFDALVVDCENEQNASLIFKSARNSSSNQSSLAIAVVEGQAGVAKAYRIGANLVLTKPINVEQAKGTLRVARGLLRKNSDPAGAPTTKIPATVKTIATPSATSEPSESSYTAPNQIAPPPAPEPENFELAELEVAQAAVPTPKLESSASVGMTSAALIEDKLAFVPQSAAQAKPSRAAAATADEHTSAASTSTTSASMSSSTVSAAATAPAREAIPAPVKEIPAKTEASPAPAKTAEPQAISAPTFGSLTTGAPSFGGLSDEQNHQDSDGSGGSKKMAIAAVILIAVAALGYFGYTKFAAQTGSSASVPAPHASSLTAAPPAPSATPESAAAASAPTFGTVNSVANSTTNVAHQPSAAIASSALPATSPAIRLDANPAPSNTEIKKSAVAPIRVKSNASASSQPQAPADEQAPALQATADDKNLSGIVSSVPTTQPTLAIVKVSQGVSQGLLIKRVNPKYPPAALATRTQGAVEIEATITRDGSVTNLKVLKGDPILARAALDAVRQWRYKPYYLDGQPVEIDTQITVNFKAD